MNVDRVGAELVVTGIGEAYTARTAATGGPDDPSLDRSTFVPELVRGAALACGGGRILYVGPEEGLEEAVDTGDARQLDAQGALVTPGLIDAHTHMVYGGSRHDEYALRSTGASYLEIAEAGGGIRSTVGATRGAGEEQLEAGARMRLEAALALGTTTVEIKSGYGLETETELKTLEVIRALAEGGPQRVEATFLGAHEVPDGYRDRREAYIELVIEEMIPAAAEQGIASFCDVFCEKGVFTAEETERILAAGLGHGLRPKVHSDEFEAIGGTEAAVRVGAVSADHLTAVTSSGIRALAGSGTVPVLLPGTTLFLGKTDYAPARTLLEAGAPVALATDMNPGSSTFLSLPLMTTVACSMMKMHPAEALQAVTANAARALGLEGEVGTLEAGMAADLVVWDAGDYREIPYAAGHPLVRTVLIAGTPV
ncbi:MAG: imidazolonepropionase [bacterium]